MTRAAIGGMAAGRLAALCCALGCAWVLAAPALQAAPLAPASEAPAGALRELPDARLAGQGEFTWFGLSIYQAAFWVGRNGYQPATPAAAPFLLDLRYARALNGQKIAQASYQQMQKINAGSPAQRLRWLQTMTAIFPDVLEGTHLSGLYLPAAAPAESSATGASVRFFLDDKPLAEVADADFARAFFGIWLDPASTAPKLRAALLHHASPAP